MNMLYHTNIKIIGMIHMHIQTLYINSLYKHLIIRNVFTLFTINILKFINICLEYITSIICMDQFVSYLHIIAHKYLYSAY